MSNPCPIIPAATDDCQTVPFVASECYPVPNNPTSIYYYSDPINYNQVPVLTYLFGPLPNKS